MDEEEHIDKALNWWDNIDDGYRIPIIVKLYDESR